MQNWKLISSVLAIFALFSACNAVESNLNFDLNHATGSTAVVLGANFSDPAGSLSTISINEPRTVNTGLQTTGTDATLKAFFGKLYVVNHLGRDNIQIIDPQHNFETILECSVGQGTNPQQIILVSEDKGYVTLLQPEGNRSEGLSVADLLVINPKAADCDHFIIGRIDLTSLAADDGSRLPRASAMAYVNSKIYVALGDLEADYTINQSGKIAVIDTATDTVTSSITLSGRNPVAMSYSTTTNLLYVAEAEYFDPSSPFGGIEAVRPSDNTTLGLIVDDQDLGGAPGDLELTDSLGLVTIGFFDGTNYVTKVTSFTIEGEKSIQTVYTSTSYIQDIAVDENGTLLIGDRAPDVNGILFVNPENHHVIDGPIHTGAAPASITFIGL